VPLEIVRIELGKMAMRSALIRWQSLVKREAKLTNLPLRYFSKELPDADASI